MCEAHTSQQTNSTFKVDAFRRIVYELHFVDLKRESELSPLMLNSHFININEFDYIDVVVSLLNKNLELVKISMICCC